MLLVLHLSKQPANVKLADMPLHKQLQLDLPVLSVAESVLQTSIFAAILVDNENRRTDTPAVQRHSRNRLTTNTTATIVQHNYCEN